MKLFKALIGATFIVFVIYIANLIFMVNEDLKDNEPISKDPALSEEELNQKVYDSLIEQGLDESAEYFSESLEQEESSESPETVISVEPTDIITVDVGTLLNLVESDLDLAKQTYEGRWLQLSGKVVSVEHFDFRKRTVKYSWSEKPVEFIYGGFTYNIDGIKVESPLVYWLAVEQRFVQPDVVVEMDISLCPHPEKEDCYLFYSQYSSVTVLAYCASVSENNVVLIDGRYPE